jgi:hypothetical protein
MTWEWVAPTATAAVGLAGIAATWLTARASRIDQRNMVLIQYEQAAEATLRETRRKAYATLLADLHSVFHSAAFTSVPGYSEDVSLEHDLSRSLAEARILGSDAVRQLAEQIVPKVLRYKAERIKARDESITYYEYQETRTGINGLLYVLERLMASDLGIPVTGTMEEWKKQVGTLKDAYDVLEDRRNQGRGARRSAEDTDHQD